MPRFCLKFLIAIFILFSLGFSEKEDKENFEDLLKKCDYALDMGNIYYQEERYCEAVNEFKKAIEKEKNFIV